MNFHAMQYVFGVLGAVVFVRYFLIRCVATIADPRMWRLVIGRVRTGEWRFEE
ncbi:MAG: hypothetical protein JWO71_605 [Candidatus Acidoferrum typicum]|nr:hypothetical protein [Candidatus Acidoferrum typicum]